MGSCFYAVSGRLRYCLYRAAITIRGRNSIGLRTKNRTPSGANAPEGAFEREL